LISYYKNKIGGVCRTRFSLNLDGNVVMFPIKFIIENMAEGGGIWLLRFAAVGHPPLKHDRCHVSVQGSLQILFPFKDDGFLS
jgi:hypothetical protein